MDPPPDPCLDVALMTSSPPSTGLISHAVTALPAQPTVEHAMRSSLSHPSHQPQHHHRQPQPHGQDHSQEVEHGKKDVNRNPDVTTPSSAASLANEGQDLAPNAHSLGEASTSHEDSTIQGTSVLDQSTASPISKEPATLPVAPPSALPSVSEEQASRSQEAPLDQHELSPVRGIGEASTPPLPMTTTPPAPASAPPPPILHPLMMPMPPMFSAADEPPPYSPTHTILPHYFSLEPIPIRTYLIRDSNTLPFLLDFWLFTASTQQQHPASLSSLSRPQSMVSSRPQSPTMQFQERGLAQGQGSSPAEPGQFQHPQSSSFRGQLKYCLIRPTHTDRTAFMQAALSSNPYFLPAVALVGANYPSRWVWWGTEALRMVVFGRQGKNLILEWRWKHGRTRIGGPVVGKLVGCGFRMSEERRFCWKVGTGRTVRQRGERARENERRRRRQGRQRQERGRGEEGEGVGEVGEDRMMAPSGGGSSSGGGGWFGSFFSRSANRPSSNATTSTPRADGDDQVNISMEPETSNPTTTGTPAINNDDQANSDDDDEDDEEIGAYHCREESNEGITGRIVAVYKPGRPANRARDRPATTRKLEIYMEVGERCETAMMLMCTRLDDLFMSIPEQKRARTFLNRATVSTATGTAADGEDGLEADNGGADGGDLHVQDQGDDQARSAESTISLKQRLRGSPREWKVRIKWMVAAVLVAVVVILVTKPRWK